MVDNAHLHEVVDKLVAKVSCKCVETVCVFEVLLPADKKMKSGKRKSTKYYIDIIKNFFFLIYMYVDQYQCLCEQVLKMCNLSCY